MTLTAAALQQERRRMRLRILREVADRRLAAAQRLDREARRESATPRRVVVLPDAHRQDGHPQDRAEEPLPAAVISLIAVTRSGESRAARTRAAGAGVSRAVPAPRRPRGAARAG